MRSFRKGTQVKTSTFEISHKGLSEVKCNIPEKLKMNLYEKSKNKPL